MMWIERKYCTHCGLGLVRLAWMEDDGLRWKIRGGAYSLDDAQCPWCFNRVHQAA